MLSRQMPHPTPELYVALRLGHERVVCALHEVREVIPVPALSRVPGAPGWIRGVAQVRGQLLPVVDPSRHPSRDRAGGGVTPDAVRARVVVVSDGRWLAGLLVDEILGVKRPPEPATDAPSASGDLLIEGEAWSVLHAATFLSDSPAPAGRDAAVPP